MILQYDLLYINTCSPSGVNNVQGGGLGTNKKDPGS